MRAKKDIERLLETCEREIREVKDSWADGDCSMNELREELSGLYMQRDTLKWVLGHKL